MAYRMKIVLILLAACGAVWAGISAIDLPQQVRYDEGWVKPSADLKRMQTEAASLVTTMRRLAVADSVRALLATSSAPIVAVYDSSPSISAEITAQLKRTPEPRARIAVLVLPPGYGSPKSGGGFNPPAEFIFGGAAAAPWCAAVHYKFGRDGTPRQEQQPPLIGPCAFWAGYGPPGAAIQSWLVNGGYGFADGYDGVVTDDGVDVRPRRRAFGLRQNWLMESLVGERCLSGRSGACAEAVMDTSASGRQWIRSSRALPDAPPAYARGFWGAVTFGFLDPTMLAMLERRYGREKFSQFWRSSEPVEPAFHAAFGLSLDEFVRDWAQAAYGKEPDGPRMSLVTVLLALATVVALWGIALRIVQRRAVQ